MSICIYLQQENVHLTNKITNCQQEITKVDNQTNDIVEEKTHMKRDFEKFEDEVKTKRERKFSFLVSQFVFHLFLLLHTSATIYLSKQSLNANSKVNN